MFENNKLKKRGKKGKAVVMKQMERLKESEGGRERERGHTQKTFIANIGRYLQETMRPFKNPFEQSVK